MDEYGLKGWGNDEWARSAVKTRQRVQIIDAIRQISPQGATPNDGSREHPQGR